MVMTTLTQGLLTQLCWQRRGQILLLLFYHFLIPLLVFVQESHQATWIVDQTVDGTFATTLRFAVSSASPNDLITFGNVQQTFQDVVMNELSCYYTKRYPQLVSRVLSSWPQTLRYVDQSHSPVSPIRA